METIEAQRDHGRMSAVAIIDDGVVVEIVLTPQGAESQGNRRFGKDQFDLIDYPQRFHYHETSINLS